MVSDYFVKQTIRMFYEIAKNLIDPTFRLPQGGEPTRIMRTALRRLEEQYGALTANRVTDYVICAAYPFKDRGGDWKFKNVFGPKSLERFNTDKGRVYFENKWLENGGLTRAGLMDCIVDKSEHPKAKYVYLPSEERTKMRLLNKNIGFAICQNTTLGWSPLSEACSLCQFTEKCKQETKLKYSEIYRLRIEYASKQ